MEANKETTQVQQALASETGRDHSIAEVEAIIDHDEERKIVWKIDLVIIPILTVCYMLQFLDKTSMSYASIMGIIKDLHLHGTEYSWSSSIFYFGYMIMQYPASLLLVKLPVAKYTSVTVLIWAGIIMLHAACHNFAGIATVRFFLGMAEATVAPAFALLISLWYKREEQASRQCLWFLGNAIAGFFGSLSAYGIAHVKGSLQPWKYFFLIFGGATVVWSLVMLFFLPDHPKSAKFLTPRQRAIANTRVLVQSQAGSKVDNTWRKDQFLEAIMDPHAWLLFLYTFAMNIGNGGLTSFGSLIISGFGYSVIQTYLLQMPVAAAQIVWILLGALLTYLFKKSRLAIMIFFVILSLIGTAMMFGLPTSQPRSRLAGFCFTTAYVANFPLSLALITTNFKGFTKKSTVIAMLLIAYCVGNIAGPQFFLAKEAPRYPTGLKAGVAGFSCAIVMLVFIWILLAWRNKQRDQQASSSDTTIPSNDEKIGESVIVIEEDVTDLQDNTFRYIM